MLHSLYNLSRTLLFCCQALVPGVLVSHAIGQETPADFTADPVLFEAVRQGQCINPLMTEDGSQLWFSQLASSEDALKAGSGQDIWMVERKDGQWGEPTNNLPGLNTAQNDLIVGQSANGKTIYHVTIRQNSDEGLDKIKVSKRVNGMYELDHVIAIPGLELFSEFYGYYVHPDEKLVVLSIKGRYSFGKEDLYISRKNADGTWGEPEHLGGTINTTGYEMSPFLSPDTRHLYYASERKDINGESDIYVSRRLSDSWKEWSKPVQLGPKVNSPGFDAYFTFNPYTQDAFFISDRSSHTGLYHIHFDTSHQEKKSLSPHMTAFGFIRLEKLPVMNVQLALIDENDKVVQQMTTDENGYFNFSDFLPDRDYKIAIDGQTREELRNMDIYLANADADNAMYINNRELGIFGFKVMSDHKIGDLGQLEEAARKGAVVDSSVVIKGMVNAYGTLNGKVKLNILDDEQNIIKSVETDETGAFSFSTDARDQSYFLSVDQHSSGLVDVYEILLTNDNPNEDIVVSKTDKHLFGFTALGKNAGPVLKMLEEDDQVLSQHIIRKYGMHRASTNQQELSGFVRMDKLPLINVKVELLNEQDHVLGEAITATDGSFSFPITEEGEYKLKLSDTDRNALGNSEIFIARSPAEMLVYLQRDQPGVFAFKKLGGKKKFNSLDSFEEAVGKGEVVKPKASIKGRFDYAKLPAEGVELKLIDEFEQVIEITKVDENGHFEFENFTVDRNYFISVEEGVGGLADVYEIYLSGGHKNVLVNRTNKFVFAFKILPSMNVLLSEAYTRQSVPDTAVPLSNFTPRNRIPGSGAGRSFYEIDLRKIANENYAPLLSIARQIEDGMPARVRLTKKGTDAKGGNATISKKEINGVVNYFMGTGISESNIEIRHTGSDQVIILLKP